MDQPTSHGGLATLKAHNRGGDASWCRWLAAHAFRWLSFQRAHSAEVSQRGGIGAVERYRPAADYSEENDKLMATRLQAWAFLQAFHKMSFYKGRPFLKLVVAQKLERTLPKLIDSPSLCKKWVHAKMSPYKLTAALKLACPDQA
ncbi:hypothetical protein E4U32_003117 [Claviceps aff. humidiphila group G2b]|nr:hypothetical protein E4U32_003117 [Claviceps aff. humidiphila group G2b]